MGGAKNFGRIKRAAVAPAAIALLEASHGHVAVTPAGQHEIPQATLSVAVQGCINAAITKGGISTGDIACALGAAFATFAANQGRDQAATERMIIDLADAGFLALSDALERRRAH